MWQGVLNWIEGLPNAVVYLGLGAGAALENVMPAIPADSVVVLGGFLSAVGDLNAWWVFGFTWVGNVASALFMVRVGRTHGPSFFSVGWGRKLLNPHQLARVTAFYARFGHFATFASRFLPGLRVVVPVFAGVTHQPILPVAVQLALASAIWYGALVWAGTLAGHNVDRVMAVLGDVNAWLLVVAVVAGVAAFLWWWRTRHHG